MITEPDLANRDPRDTAPRAGGARLLLVGPMIGRNPGLVTTQGETLAKRLAAAGHQVVSVSALPNRYVRLLHIAATIVAERNRTEILVVQLYGGPSFVVEDLATRLGKLFGHRVILHAHGGALPEFLARHPAWGRRVLRRADAVVAPSEYLAGPLAEHGAPRPRVVANIIEPGAYPFRVRRSVAPRLLWMRSFHPIYNPLMAVRVLARLRGEYPGAALVMAGQDKGMDAAVREEAGRLGVSDGVRIAGFLDHAAKIREGASADIFINTNRVDNAPVAVIEACAMGLPVVSTAVGGVPFLLQDGVTGLLVADDDDAAMAAAIRRLLGDPALAAGLSTRGRALAERCAWEAVGPAWDEVFRAVRRPAGGEALA